MTIEHDLVTIDPETATKWLEANTNNRPIYQMTVDRYAEMMRLGQWKLDGNSIKFSSADELLDGQHRLWACIQSGVPFTTLVVWNIEPAAQSTMDIGKKRTTSDALSLKHKAPNASALGGALRLYVAYERGILTSSVRNAITIDDMLAVYEADRNEWDWAASIGKSIGQEFRASPSGLSAFIYAARKKAPLLSSQFIEGVHSGVGLEAGDPRLALRSWMTANAAARRSTAPGAVVMMTAVHAFNLFVQHKRVKTIRSVISDPPAIRTAA